MRAYIAPETQSYESEWHFSHAVSAAGLVFISGVTGVGDDTETEEEQFHRAFKRLDQSLAAAGITMAGVVDLTSFHVGLRDHMTTFRRVKDHYFRRPFPAWTAVGVVDLASEKATVELRAVAESVDQ